LMVTIETKGRRSGKPRTVPLVVAEVGQDRFLVSMLGDGANWVRNVRAANGEAVLHHGTADQVVLEEVAPSERAPILRAYLKRAPGGRPHFDVDADSPNEELTRIASLYPVFRIRPRR
jgi:deazaflavin-dependent oxidoreductase (nitroreductase family)